MTSICTRHFCIFHSRCSGVDEGKMNQWYSLKRNLEINPTKIKKYVFIHKYKYPYVLYLC